MRLTHHSNKPVVFDSQRIYVQGVGSKPKGLWVSVDDDWRRWCTDETYGVDNLLIIHKVILHRDANILHLADANGIDWFTYKYKEFANDNYRIDWRKVAKLYDGIIIAPYCWERRLGLEADWYYPWDCASGCIWNFDAIRSIDVALPNLALYAGLFV